MSRCLMSHSNRKNLHHWIRLMGHCSFRTIPKSPMNLMIPSCQTSHYFPTNPSYHWNPSYLMTRSNRMIHCYPRSHWILSIR
jgi:hypothetical protein